MSTIVQLAVAVGEPPLLPLADAVTVAAAAVQAGIAAVRITDGGLDPTVVAAYLAGRHGGVGYLVELPTTGNAPYNAARRILSLDRAAGGRVGVALQAGDGDEVTGVSAPTDAARRWTEYSRVLIKLWESFPRAALIGDQEAGIVADDSLIRPIGHDGDFYRVAGPLDGPSSVQGRPVIVADLGRLTVADVAATADVVVAGRDTSAGVRAALPGAVLLGRVSFDTARPDAAELLAWAEADGLDGFELAPTGGRDEVLATLRDLVPQLTATAAPPVTLRAGYGLAAVAR
ncbi:MAG: hypothetical protein ABW046_17080 [Actinoplanes sp.]